MPCRSPSLLSTRRPRRRARCSASPVLRGPARCRRRAPASARPRLPGRARLRGQAGPDAAPCPTGDRARRSSPWAWARPSEVTSTTLRRAAAALVRRRRGTTSGRHHAARRRARGLEAGPRQAIAEGRRSAATGSAATRRTPKPCRLERSPSSGRGGERCRRGVERGARIAAAVALARDLVNEPAGAMTPRRLAAGRRRDRRARGPRRSRCSTRSSIANDGPRRSARRGRAAPTSRRGSSSWCTTARAVRRRKRRAPTLALVGKGITFDSGGLSLKTGRRHGDHEDRHGRRGRGARRPCRCCRR